ncbi:class I SAM-dependent methyltransferase [bacterium]|nr:class I SAM-dependent methyltransferase [bacterium]
MKSARSLEPCDPAESRLRDYDLREIDADDQRSHFALKYLDRLEAVRAALRRHVPAPGLVAEIGCAQANLGLLLAEEGYTVVALDLMPEALSYARRKYERGVFLPLCASAAAVPLRSGVCDALVVGELLEHCAEPAQVLATLCGCLKPGGMVFLTTPNGARLRSRERLYDGNAEPDLTQRQFGPGGEDHLFAFDLPGLLSVARQAGLEVLEHEYHASMLHSDRLRALKRLFAPSQLRALSRRACRLPLIGPRTALTLLVVARRPMTEAATDQPLGARP